MNKLSEFLQNPALQHHDAVNHIISYLYRTRNLVIEYSSTSDPTKLYSYYVFTYASDVAFRDDTATRKSTKGYLFQLFGGSID